MKYKIEGNEKRKERRKSGSKHQKERVEVEGEEGGCGKRKKQIKKERRMNESKRERRVQK